MKNLFSSPYFTPEYKILNYSAVIILETVLTGIQLETFDFCCAKIVIV